MILDRVDHLPAVPRRLLQIASVMGPVVSRRVLDVAAAGLLVRAPGIQDVLWELEDRGLLLVERAFPFGGYSFDHVITQEAVCRSLAPAARAHLHDRVAAAIEKTCAGNLEEHLEALALHYGRAENYQKAAEYLLAAGRKAWRNSAR